MQIYIKAVPSCSAFFIVFHQYIVLSQASKYVKIQISGVKFGGVGEIV